MPHGCVSVRGVIHNVNTLEAFKKLDLAAVAQGVYEKVRKEAVLPYWPHTLACMTVCAYYHACRLVMSHVS